MSDAHGHGGLWDKIKDALSPEQFQGIRDSHLDAHSSAYSAIEDATRLDAKQALEKITQYMMHYDNARGRLKDDMMEDEDTQNDYLGQALQFMQRYAQQNGMTMTELYTQISQEGVSVITQQYHNTLTQERIANARTAKLHDLVDWNDTHDLDEIVEGLQGESARYAAMDANDVRADAQTYTTRHLNEVYRATNMAGGGDDHGHGH